jgi:serine/threonine-protein kinase
MGEVRQCSEVPLHRRVALKTATTGDRAHLSRFVREAQVQGQLEHPNIVPVHDLGLGPDGAPYFTMKRVQGDTLTHVLALLSSGDAEARERFPRRRLLLAFQSVCQAVDFAHTRGWLHRDLKPSNVMLGDFGEVYVLDWGLARQMDELDGASTADPLASAPGLTVPGSLMGTAGYMAPEQVVGQPATVRSDVWALGAMLFEVLTYQSLARGHDILELMLDTKAGCDARARQRAPDLDVPPELEAVCIKATNHDPTQRYATVRELHAAVDRVLAGERDQQLRVTLAAQHTLAAKEAIARAAQDLEHELDHRRAALRELGLALSLVPRYPPALVGLLGLMSLPTRKMPAEVAQELSATRAVEHRAAARGSFFVFAGLTAFGVGFGWSRVHHTGVLIAMMVLGFGSAAVGALGGWGRRDPRFWVWLSMAMTSLTVMNVFFLTGPLGVVPVFGCMNAVAYSMGVGRRLRPIVIIVGLVTVLLPLLGSWLGLLPGSFHYVKEGLVLIPLEDTFDPRSTTFILTICLTGAVVTTCSMVGAMADARHAAERRRVLQSWSLKQMLPVEAAAAPTISRQ